MNARMWLMGVAALALVCWPGSARATTLVSDDFESYTDVTSSWLSYTDNDPNGPGWTVDEDGSQRVQVMRSPVTSTGYKFDTPYGSQYLHLYRGGDGMASAFNALTSAAQTTIAANGNMRVEIDAHNVSGIDGWGGNIGIAAYDNAIGEWNNCAFDISLRSDGALWAYEGASTRKISGAYTPNAWNKLAIDVDFVTDRCSVSVDGTSVVDDLVFAGGDLSKVQFLDMQAWWNSATGTPGRGGFDNLVVSTVPEPSSAALAVTGIMGLLAYAWRKRK